ncbi:unnamed protein product [Somion occarium]
MGCTHPSPDRAMDSALNIEVSCSRRIKYPPELVEELLDWLHGDRDTLLCCSFVSHLWYSMTRRRLFHTIKLRLDQDDERLTDFILFLGMHETIPTHIRTLHLDSSCSSTHRRIRPMISLDILARLLLHLPQLSELEMTRVMLQPSQSYDTLPVGAFQLDKLTLCLLNDIPAFSDHPDAIGWLQFLSLFSKIRRLNSYMNRLLPTMGDTHRKFLLQYDQRMDSFLHVQSLTIQGLVPAFVDRVISNALATDAGIRHLHVQTSCDFLSHLECIGPILSKCGQHIQSLRIDVRDSISPPKGELHMSAVMAQWDYLQLPKCIDLKILNIVLCISDGDCVTDMSLEACMHIITRTPPSLRRLRITLNALPVDPIYPQEKVCPIVLGSTRHPAFWGCMERIQATLPSLESVTFDMMRDSFRREALPEDARKSITDNLPSLHQRNILQT